MIFTFALQSSYGQTQQPEKKLKPCYFIQPALGTAGLGGLYFLWYKDFPSTNFHFFNDGNQWLGMDKIGHFYSGYYLTHLSSLQYASCIYQSQKAIKYGAISSFAFLTAIEIFDGFSANWGASIPDFTVNTLGIGMYAAQERAFGEQRIVPKFSYTKSAYSDFRPSVLGSSFTEQLFKDYNGQTYWFSTSLGKWRDTKKWIAILGISIGYGATGMIGGKSNPLFDENHVPFPDVERRTQFYLALSVDWTEIPTSKVWLQKVVTILNGIKVPLPGLVFHNSSAQFRMFAY